MAELNAPLRGRRVGAAVAQHTEVAVLVALLAGTRLLRNPSVPPAIYGLGIVAGCTLALHSIGLVIVHRSNRIINFAQVEMGLLGGAVFAQLTGRKLLLVGLRKVCTPCLPTPDTVNDLSRISGPGMARLLQEAGLAANGAKIPPGVLRDALPRGISLDDLAVRAAPGWLVQVSFWLSMAISLALVVLLSWAVYSLVVRRFSRAPRLIVTVMTVGLAAVFLFLRDAGTTLVGKLAGDAGGGSTTFFDPDQGFPFRLSLELSAGGSRVTLGTTEIVLFLVTVVALVALTVFFARSSIGIVLRGASENPDRSQTLGVNVEGVTSVAWMLAGGLSGLASIIAATGTGVGGASTIVPYLAAAVFGGLTSIPITAAAALTLGVVDRSVQWSVKTPGFMDGLLLVVIVVVLLVQRSRRARTDTEDAGWKAAREARPIPAELRGLDVVGRWVRTLTVAGAIVVLGIPWVLSPSQINLFTVTLVYGMIALSLLVLTGWAGQMSLGQFAIAGIGAYVTALTRLPLPLSLVIGGLAGTVVAVVIGVPALRLRGLHLAISTLAFAVAVTSILLNPRYFGKALPDTLQRPTLLGLRLDDQRTFFYVTLAFLVLTVLAVMGMRRSRTGRALIASRENEAAAQAFGINLLSARLGAFAISGFIAAFAGGVFAYSQYGVNASNFSYTQSVKMFLMVVIGGLGSITGPLAGAAYVGISEVIGSKAKIPFFSDGVLGIGTVILMLFVPGGFGELIFGIRDAMLRRVADRYRIDVPSLLDDRRRTAGRRAPIIPMTRPGGGTVFVPKRYRADGQWSVERRYEDALSD